MNNPGILAPFMTGVLLLSGCGGGSSDSDAGSLAQADGTGIPAPSTAELPRPPTGEQVMPASLRPPQNG